MPVYIENNDVNNASFNLIMSIYLEHYSRMVIDAVHAGHRPADFAVTSRSLRKATTTTNTTPPTTTTITTTTTTKHNVQDQ